VTSIKIFLNKIFILQINTYVTHPWIFNCAETGECLKVNQSYVFYPEPWFRFITNSENGVVSVGRQEIQIHYPLKTLKNICMWKILFLLNSPNDINNLDIPNSLKNELTILLDESNRKLPENDNIDND
jgi:von Hippel-Lindau disease tumor supressor